MLNQIVWNKKILYLGTGLLVSIVIFLFFLFDKSTIKNTTENVAISDELSESEKINEDNQTVNEYTLDTNSSAIKLFSDEECLLMDGANTVAGMASFSHGDFLYAIQYPYKYNIETRDALWPVINYATSQSPEEVNINAAVVEIENPKVRTDYMEIYAINGYPFSKEGLVNYIGGNEENSIGLINACGNIFEKYEIELGGEFAIMHELYFQARPVIAGGWPVNRKPDHLWFLLPQDVTDDFKKDAYQILAMFYPWGVYNTRP